MQLKATDKLFIRSAKICDPSSSWNGKTTNILISSGKIEKIGEGLEAGNETLQINGEGCYISPTFFDLCANAGEPGFERREDLESVSLAALIGGFGGIAIMPNTQPALHSKSEIELIVNKARSLPVDLIPVGAISRKREGLEMAELYDMWLSGAKAFSDGDHALQQSGLMMRALQYVADFGGLIMASSEDASLAGGAKVHEGIESLKLGMKGIPSIAEELMISRDLMLAGYTGTRIHFTALSSAGSVELIRRAKKEGLKVTCSVAAYQLILDDSWLQTFDSNFKVKPPLRTAEDREALISGLVDGTIDAICTAHTPQEVEFKHVEFETANYGMIGLETCYSLVNEALEAKLSQNEITKLLCIAPRQILGLPIPLLKEGEVANFTLFNPTEQFTFERKDLGSRSYNTPFLGKQLHGRIKAVYSKGFLMR